MNQKPCQIVLGVNNPLKYIYMSFLWYVLIGIASGFVAGKLMRGGGFGLIMNLIVGIIGGVLGGWLFGLLGIATGGIIGSLITSVIGAIVLLWIVNLVSRTVSG